MSVSSFAVAALGRRPDFAGSNDKYMQGLTPSLADKLDQALRGEAPFDVKGNLFSEQYRNMAMQRLNRYREAWRFYNGEHWVNEWDEGDRKPVFNYCGTIVDKAVEWYVAKGIKVESDKGNELIADLLNTVWTANDQHTVLQKLIQYGAVTGDAFLYVTVNTVDENGKELPKTKWTVCLNPIDPAYVFPFWSESDPGSLNAVLMQFPLLYGSEQKLYTIYITRTTFETWINEVPQVSQPNPFRHVNVVYFPNQILANSPFSVSDIVRVIPVNEAYNETANSIRRTIKYQGEPTTVIYGAKASTLERAANAVWSGLPVEARVENLKLESDLKANYEYLDRLEAKICVLSSTPKVALEAASNAVSNTSGLAMQMLYQPLIDKTSRRQNGHLGSYKQINKLILVAHERFMGDDINALADYPQDKYVSRVEFSSPLPKDEAAELDLAIKRLSVGIWSRAEAIRRVSNVTDLNRLTLELAADDRAELVQTYEIAQASNGIPPNRSSVFLSSPFLSEDLPVTGVSGSEDEVDVT